MLAIESTFARLARAAGAMGIVVAALSPRAAHAQASRADVAVAESLFRAAKDAVGELRFDEACPKFEESHRLDPKLGTLLNLALCHEQQGKVATAWGDFTAAVRESKRVGRADREAFALEHVRSLEPRLSFLRVTSQEPAATIVLDGREFSAASLGSRLAVDPGPHVLEARAPRRKPWKKIFDVGKEPSIVELLIPTLPADAPSSIAEPPTPDAPKPLPGRSVGPLVGSGAVAVVGLGIGAGFGVVAIAKHAAGNDVCDGTVCRGDGESLQKEARSAAWISTAAFGAGAVASAVFLYLVLRAPDGGTNGNAGKAPIRIGATPTTDRGGAVFDLRGTF